jgi:hypothetical protein
MKLTNGIALSLLALLLCGCTSTYHVNPILQVANLSVGKSGYVAQPKDGSFENEDYHNSGRQAALAVASALAKHLPRVDVASETKSLELNLAEAKSQNFDYLFFPIIVHWENRATEWSGKLDRIQIELRTFDVPTGKILSYGDIQGSSKWASFGGDSPEDLLKAPIDAYVQSLFTGRLKEPREQGQSQPFPAGKR